MTPKAVKQMTQRVRRAPGQGYRIVKGVTRAGWLATLGVVSLAEKETVERVEQWLRGIRQDSMVPEAEEPTEVRHKWSESHTLEDEVEVRVRHIISDRRVPSLDEVHALEQELETLNLRLETILSQILGELGELPDDYRWLTLPEALARLDNMTLAQLRAARRYEETHHKRIAVLRAIDRRTTDLLTSQSRATV